jgi:hypothetical protein
MRCIHCPTPDNIRCVGLDVRRLCELIDPQCSQYNAGYRNVILREARQPGESADTPLASYQHRGSGKPISEGAETTGFPTDCCGGGLSPGIFDDPEIDNT